MLSYVDENKGNTLGRDCDKVSYINFYGNFT